MDNDTPQDEAVRSDWDSAADDAPVKRGHPILAIIIGAVAAIILASAGNVSMPGNSAELAGMVMGRALTVTLIVWGIAYWATLRRCSIVWKIVSFIIIGLLAFIASAGKYGERAGAANEDAAGLIAQVSALAHANANGELPALMPTDSGGPMQRMAATLFNGVIEDARTFETAARRSGLKDVLAMDSLQPNSPALRNCGAITGLNPLAVRIGLRMPEHIAAARRVGEGFVQAGDMSQETLDGFLDGSNGALERYRRQWTLNAELVRHGAAICRGLATSRWQRAANGQIEFFDTAAMNSVNQHIVRAQQIVAEQQSLQQTARTNVDAMRDDWNARQQPTQPAGQ